MGFLGKGFFSQDETLQKSVLFLLCAELPGWCRKHLSSHLVQYMAFVQNVGH